MSEEKKPLSTVLETIENVNEGNNTILDALSKISLNLEVEHNSIQLQSKEGSEIPFLSLSEDILDQFNNIDFDLSEIQEQRPYFQPPKGHLTSFDLNNGDILSQLGSLIRPCHICGKGVLKDELINEICFECHNKKELFEDAINEFKKILEGNPSYALAYEGMGLVYFKATEFDKAKQNLSEALKLDDRLWQAHNLLGIIYDRKGQFEAAIIHYRAAITLNPHQGILLNNLGVSYCLQGEYEKAVETFLEALKTETSNTKIYNNLALTLSKLERYEDALEAFKRGQTEAAAYNNIGYIYMIEGKYREAIKALEKAIEVNPTFYTRANENLEKAKATTKALP